MPIYEYKCAACDHQMEVFASMSEPPPAACEQCGGVELSKILFPVSVHYKGSGFYSTDYGNKKPAAASGESQAESSSSDSSNPSGSSSSSSSGSSESGSGSSSESSSGSSPSSTPAPAKAD